MLDLMSNLAAAPYGFDLFQGIRLLERAAPERLPVGSSLGLDEAVRLSGHVDLSFPASDIRAVDASHRSGPPTTLSTAALTLAGGHGPLPLPFTEMLMEDARLNGRAGLDFLDIFNQRLLGFLYRARRKHSLSLMSGSPDGAPMLRVLDALSGLGRGEGARSPGGHRGWLRHAGLQGPAPRSMASLLALVRDRLGVRFQARQFHGGWHRLALPERARLSAGSSAVLDGSCALGARAWDQGAGFELSAPSLSCTQFASLLPGGSTHDLLAWLVARHQQREMQVVLQPVLLDPPPTKLSATGPLPARLGRSAWLSGTYAPGHAKRQVEAPRFLLNLEADLRGH